MDKFPCGKSITSFGFSAIKDCWIGFMNLIDQKFLKFLAVGVVNTIVGAGVMFLLYNVFEVSYWISSACNYIVGGTVSFFLNKFFTFKNNQKSLKQVVLFILTLAVCYFIAYIAAKKIIYFTFSTSPEKIKGNIALVCGMCLYTGLNYLGQRLIVFSEKNEKSEENI
jgi:putative flippase GtrA